MKRNLFYSGALAIAAAALTSTAHADAKGEAILRAAFKKLGDAKAMTAAFTRSFQAQEGGKALTYPGTIAALKPNYLTVKISGQSPDGARIEQVFAATGKDYYTFANPDGQGESTYQVEPNAPNPTEFAGEWEAEVDAFFGGEKNLSKGTPEYSGTEKIGKVTCDLIKMKLKPTANNPERVITYAVGQKDKLIYRSSWLLQTRGTTIVQSNTLSDINLKADKKPEDFAYTPPKDSKKFIVKKNREVILASGDLTPKGR